MKTDPLKTPNLIMLKRIVVKTGLVKAQILQRMMSEQKL